jgi:putative phosphotransacetylase
MKIPVGVSNRHCHLTKEVYYKLFNKEDLTFKKDINQPTQFAAEECVTIKGPKGIIENVRILGPFRSYNQVEVSKTDTYKLGINPPVRCSGHLDGAEDITIIGPCSEITIPCAILANRHIHISKDEANKLNIKDNEPVLVKINTEKKGTIEAFFKVSDIAYKEIHLDTDDANGFLLKQNDEVEIELKNDN